MKSLSLFTMESPTIGQVDPHNSVSKKDILNWNDPEVIERLQGTYWFEL
ncbi:hypothetical protein [Paenibacillus monticola]|uniref:Uncharacterized protein n=1 Tax=Paenibacillus monticola TaxID=2666075 RepID=A0A7X2H9I5_9BACL|nr:hypothetical protein [Paenibacillus monticola]MRN56042.1 hypothetical protein [Paenibacillus monticola]